MRSPQPRPAAAHTLLGVVLQVLRKAAPAESCDELFGIGDVGVANHHLLTIGGFELALRRQLGDHGQDVLASLLVAIRAGLRPAILGLPAVVKALREAGSVAEPVVVGIATSVRGPSAVSLLG